MPRMRPFRVFLFLVLFLTAAANAFAKPTAVVYPVKFTGLKNPSQQQIMQNQIRSQLGSYFELKTPKELQAAIEQVRDVISSENCTEDACIKKINSILNVNYSFTFHIVADGNYWDFSANRVDDLGVSSLKNTGCKNCTISKAKVAITDTVRSLSPNATTIKGKAKLVLNSNPSADVFVEGRLKGSTPLELEVDAAKPIEIYLSAEGYKEFSSVYTLKSGETKKPEMIQLARERGKIELTSEPVGASIYLDDQKALTLGDKQAVTPFSLRPTFGEHKITLKKKNYEDLDVRLNVDQSQIVKKKLVMVPVAARLLVKVDAKYKNSTVFADGKVLGTMGGKVMKSFALSASVEHEVYFTHNGKESTSEYVTLEANGSQKIDIEFGAGKVTKKEPLKILSAIRPGDFIISPLLLSFSGPTLAVSPGYFDTDTGEQEVAFTGGGAGIRLFHVSGLSASILFTSSAVDLERNTTSPTPEDYELASGEALETMFSMEYNWFQQQFGATDQWTGYLGLGFHQVEGDFTLVHVSGDSETISFTTSGSDTVMGFGYTWTNISLGFYFRGSISDNAEYSTQKSSSFRTNKTSSSSSGLTLGYEF